MSYFRNLNPYDLHKKLINEYFLKRPGDTNLLFERDTTRDKTDVDILRENHRFLWDDDEDGENNADTWEKRFAKRYYDKLFKEYCIADLSRYKENKIALRWRIEKEVISGKGQFICGNKICNEKNDLRSWEVNFAYVEQGIKRNALIKLRLCPDCSVRLNYHSKKREVKRTKKEGKNAHKKDHKRSKKSTSPGPSNQCSDGNGSEANQGEEIDDNTSSNHDASTRNMNKQEESCWTKVTDAEEKTREDEFDDYLADLLL